MLRSSRMTKVIVIPAGIEFEARAGETIMGAAIARRLSRPPTCGGQGICTTCLSEVIEGDDCLFEMGRGERKTIAAERGEAALGKNVRLACQAVIRAGDRIVIDKSGVREAV